MHNDLQPTIFENTPQCYIKLMKKCWERDLINHLLATKICETLAEWQDDKNILSELIKSDEILKNINSTHIQSYPVEYYKSIFINYTTTLLYQ
ncbi:9821_t:CDS:1, partial [Cetraspora pellucida]